MNRVLVVDDETGVLETLSSSLTRRGYLVNAVSSGEEGIAKVKVERFDVALIDIKMPGMDGITLLEHIKKIDSEIEVVMITGYASIESVKECMQKGAYDYIEKPLDANRIGMVIEKALEKRQLTTTVALYEISKAIFSTIEMDELLKIIVDLAMKVLRADDSSIMLFDENEKLCIAFSHGLDEDIKKNTSLAIGEKIAGWVAETRQPIILINGLTNDPRFADIQGRDNIKSAIVSPLLKNDKLLGILTVNRKEIDENFTKIDLYKTIVFASLVSLALDNANLYKNIQKLQNELIWVNKTLENKEKNALAMVARLEAAQEALKTNQFQLLQSAKLAALGRLVSDMAHEVNNPLMIISGNAQLSLMEEISSETVKNNLKIIFEESQRAKDIMQRLLKFSRPSKGQVKKVDINTSIESVVSLLEHQFTLSNVEIKRNYANGLPPLAIDECQMHEVFMNLLNNARDAMHEGGIITISTSIRDNCLIIDFSDTGCGMSEEVIKKVFEPFFTTKEKGTGLGLAVSYGIVKVHNGELKLKSAPGKGTTATILLPLKSN
ncbi:MAG: response regulator [Candidatus Omnitrophota bacterium]